MYYGVKNNDGSLQGDRDGILGVRVYSDRPNLIENRITGGARKRKRRGLRSCGDE
jgi:hypothetical protein